MISGVKPQLNNQPHFGQSSSAQAGAGGAAHVVSNSNSAKTKSVGLIRAVLGQLAMLPRRPFVWGVSGVTGASLALYSIAKDGVRRGLNAAKQEEGSYYKNLYMNTNSSDHDSILLEKVRGETRQFLFDGWIIPAYSKVKNVAKSLALTILENTDTLLASASAIGAAFMDKDKNKFTRVALGTVSTGYLLLKGGYTFIHEILGLGKTKN